MKKALIILVTFIIVITLGSCSKNQIIPNESDSETVGFSTYIGTASRGTVLSTDLLKSGGFGVLAYKQDDATFSDANVIPNFMYNQKVYLFYTTDWAYDLVKYWDDSAITTYSFFAYAPYNGAGISLSSNDTEGTPYIDFTIQDNSDDMVDLVAGQTLNINKYGNVLESDGTYTGSSTATQPVNINFKHQLTRITFRAKSSINVNVNGTDQTFLNITSFKILGSINNSTSKLYKTARYIFDTETTGNTSTDHEQDGTWDYTLYDVSEDDYKIIDGQSADKSAADVQETAIEYTNETTTITSTYTRAGVRVQNTQSDYTPLFGTDEYLFLIPPNGATGVTDTDEEMEIELTYDVVTLDANLGDEKYFVSTTDHIDTFYLPASLSQGYAYQYDITIYGDGTTLNPITISASVTSWPDAPEVGDEDYDDYNIQVGDDDEDTTVTDVATEP